MAIVLGSGMRLAKNKKQTYATSRRVRLKIRTIMPSLSGATKVINKEFINNEEGAATLVYFWALSCPLCEQSIKNLNEVAKLFSDRLMIRAIHMPREDLDFSPSRVKERVQQLELTYPIYLDNELQISDNFGNTVVPAYYLFDQQQQLRFYKAGYITPRYLQRKIQRIIE